MVKIRITESNSIRSSIWRKRDVSWEILTGKAKNPKLVNISYQELQNMTKDEKASHKDGQCFVGAVFKNERRKKQDVEKRTLITLDVEDPNGATTEWTVDDIKQIVEDLNYKAILYTTLSHGPGNPRCRVIVFPDREMEPEEYEPVARWYADQLGMNRIDRTTFDINRAFFYPAVTNDGEYVFDIVDGEELKVDEILAKYTDWTDPDEYPRCKEEKTITIRARQGDYQEDPLEKDSIIGDFCRTYSITKAIKEFDLPYDVAGNRATYIHGSSSSGCEIFEDKWIYSYHATDPISGMLCNSYDLVRVNLFGDDEESYKEMTDMISDDPDVMEEHRKREAKKIEKYSMTQTNDYWDWETELETRKSKTGDIIEVKRTIPNFEAILENDPELKGRIQMDNFSEQMFITGVVPWLAEKDRKIFENNKSCLKPKYKWQDKDFAYLQGYISKKYRNLEDEKKLRTALSIICNRHSFNEVRDYFRNLPEWDGTPRLETLFIDFLGAEDNIYTRMVTKIAFVAGVTRIMSNYSVKFDDLPILYSPEQGIGKSTVLQKMGMIHNGWFTDSLNSFGNAKQIAEMIEGKILCELGEMSFLSKQEIADVKQMLSSQSDRFRPAYARWAIDRRRQCMFIATANKVNLKDDKNRRFLPIKCNKQKPTKDIWKDLTQDYVDKVWAEAYWISKQGTLELRVKDEVKDMAEAIQEEFRDKNPSAGIIEAFIDKPIKKNWYKEEIHNMLGWYAADHKWTDLDILDEAEKRRWAERDKICVAEIWVLCFGHSIGSLNGNRKASNDIINVLNHLDGWEPCFDNFGPFGNTYGYHKI